MLIFSGIPEYDIPALEPIDIGDLIVAESIPGQGLSITARDIKAYGASNFKLKKLKWVFFFEAFKSFKFIFWFFLQCCRIR